MAPIPLAALNKALTEIQGSARRHCEIKVYLGSPLCRFFVLDHTRTLFRVEQLYSLAKIQMKQVMALDPKDWIVAVDPNWSNFALACAVRNSTIDPLRKLNGNPAVRLNSIQPWIGAFTQRYKTKLESPGGTFIAEPSSISRISRGRNQWVVQTLPALTPITRESALEMLAKSAGQAIGQSSECFTLKLPEGVPERHGPVDKNMGERRSRLSVDFTDRVDISNSFAP